MSEDNGKLIDKNIDKTDACELNLEDSESLADKKRSISEMNINDNIANIQVFIQKYIADGTNLHLNLSPIGMRKFTDKSYDLCKTDSCIKFFEQCEGTEYISLAIILCIFRIVYIGDLPDLKEKLMKQLPIPKAMDDKGKEIIISHKNPYLSLDSMLPFMEAKLFADENSQRCVGFDENSDQRIINIWEQFPYLRSCIVEWMLDINETFQGQTTLNKVQITEAFTRIVCADFAYAKVQIFPKLYYNQNNIVLLTSIAYKLYKKEELKKEILLMINEWIDSNRTWLWKSAYLLYFHLEEEFKNSDFEKHIEKDIRERFFILNDNDLRFISMLLCNSLGLRSMISAVFNKLYNKINSIDYKTSLTNTYIKLIRQCYYLIDSNNSELPLVACDSKEQQNNIRLIISQVIYSYSLRKQLYAILNAYLREISNYKVSNKTIKHLTAYFYNIISSVSDFKQDIIFFLENCKCRVAKQIYELLDNIYNKNNGGLSL